ncbi:hypothetical protein [Roseospirillum parvum]|uniref:CDP-Glycerol:Poly(Glycerophosphate) glycerophosphotransferase n=1 Tax=Roseospirillum parvum TaxID=83401 RepID=A0A1G8A266_9PROT|nr:hypothetical protein [Roseospirillum parvum]SDH15024.1 hypothetical protein SAMN05421742_104296 [Roseospirillum parvum]
MPSDGAPSIPASYRDQVALCRAVGQWTIEAVGALLADGHGETARLSGPILYGAIYRLLRSVQMPGVPITGIGAPPPTPEVLHRWVGAAMRLPSPSAPPVERLARRLARQATLGGLPGLMRQLPGSRPQITLTSHNTVARRLVTATGARVRFQPAEGLVAPRRAPLNRAAEGAPTTATPRSRSLAAGLGPLLARHLPQAPDDLEARAAALIAQVLAIAEAQVEVMAGLALPERPLWSTGIGGWGGRLIDLEASRRGLPVTRFSHGGGYGMVNEDVALALSELAVAERFVLATPGLARSAGQDLETAAPWCLRGRPIDQVLVGGQGDPVFEQIPFRPRRAGQRPRVLLMLSGLFEGFLHMPPVLPADLARAWRARLIALLESLDIELLIRPHPEDRAAFEEMRQGQPGRVLDGPFIECLDKADVLLFEWSMSTAFWQALCLGRPVVLIDLPGTPFLPARRDDLAQVCRVLEPGFDARGLPTIDAEALDDALRRPLDGDPARPRALFVPSS